ncbi:hypothetical protein [Actinomycetospora flava]|uniref:MYXO-CTERM domain-containing protein n=1 Tax=Actinomycetospora flava TaxID=3129232 RepID=A0ABU8M0G7_9PSEU
MRLLLTTLVAVLFLLGAGTALADPGLVIGDGAPAAPGTSLRAQMGCEEPDTTPVTGPGVTGSPWERDADGHQPWAVFSAVTVAHDAAPGPVTVTATCGGRPLEATITVAAPDSGRSVWRWLGAAALLLVIVAAMVALQRRRKQHA